MCNIVESSTIETKGEECVDVHSANQDDKDVTREAIHDQTGHLEFGFEYLSRSRVIVIVVIALSMEMPNDVSKKPDCCSCATTLATASHDNISSCCATTG